METHCQHFASTFGMIAEGESTEEITLQSYEPFQIETEQVLTTIRSLALGKAAGNDGLMAEFLVFGQKTVAKVMTALLQKIIIKATIPDEWRVA